MAESGAARKARGESPRAPSPRPARAAQGVEGEATGLNALLHNRMRLGIVSALAAAESLTFNDLKGLMQTTDGNLSVHARKLEEAQYVVCVKSFAGRRPRTEYRLAARGRRALERYLDHMEALVRTTRSALGR